MAFRAMCGERGWFGWRGGRRGSGTTGSLGDKTGRTEIGFNTRGVTIVTAEAVFPSRSSPPPVRTDCIYYIYTYTTATSLCVCVCILCMPYLYIYRHRRQNRGHVFYD